jgi:dTDP-4-amino-4,6-dideoxygalactose transaminase
MPAKIIELINIANKYGIPVIEDAAEALGSKYDGKACGTFGEMGILSFNGNKIITTSGGGALISNNDEYIQKARFLATQARDKAPHYQHSQIGYNYRMSNVLAGIGRGQLKVVEERVAKRRSNFEFYLKNLSHLKGISFLQVKQPFFSNRWLTTIIVNPEKTGGISHEDIHWALEKDNIETRPLWKPMHLQPIFRNCPSYKNGISEKLFNFGLCLPSGSNLSDQDLDRVILQINRVFA